MEQVKVFVEKVEGLTLPKYESESASGMDVRANFSDMSEGDMAERLYGSSRIININGKKAILLGGGDRYLFPTGIKVAVPVGYEIQVRPRSGFALNKGVTVLNSPGTIDADYRGEIGIILVNHVISGTIIEDGERIAQLVVTPVVHANWISITTLPNTKRGKDGFGSSGK